jgi:hypothetical protein
MSVRRIAADVFGDVSFRGRVERILGTPADTAESPEAVGAREEELRVFAGVGSTARLRRLYERIVQAMAERDEAPSPRALLEVVELDRQLRSLERLNGMTKA